MAEPRYDDNEIREAPPAGPTTGSRDPGFDLYQSIALPFVLDDQGKYADAIEYYALAQDTLEKLADGLASGGSYKADLLMMRRQISLIKQRKDIQKAQALSDDIPVTFTNFNWGTATSPFSTPLSSETLKDSTSPQEFTITHESDVTGLGNRQHWFSVRDPPTNQTLWALQMVTSDAKPINEVMLRRVGELMPKSLGAIRIGIVRTNGGARNLVMKSGATGWAIETPDRAAHRSAWTPRRFSYGGRHFVWKSEQVATANNSASSSSWWETLYETSRVWPTERSMTGKKSDQLLGERLCWGGIPDKSKMEAKIWFHPALDIGLIEHCLASQLTRWAIQSFPHAGDRGGAGDTSGGASLACGTLSLLLSILSFVLSFGTDFPSFLTCCKRYGIV